MAGEVPCSQDGTVGEVWSFRGDTVMQLFQSDFGTRSYIFNFFSAFVDSGFAI